MSWRIALSTAAGEFVAEFSDRGLRALRFPGRSVAPARSSAELPVPVRRWGALTAAALARALTGRAPGRLPPLDEAGTPFQRAVWRALRRIPPGETRSYAGVARMLGLGPAAARAVGQACGANPIPVLTPCHRVVAADGSPGGFSGGPGWKERLLQVEAGVAHRRKSRRGAADSGERVKAASDRRTPALTRR